MNRTLLDQLGRRHFPRGVLRAIFVRFAITIAGTPVMPSLSRRTSAYGMWDLSIGTSHMLLFA